MHEAPLVIRTPRPEATEVLNPEVLGGRGIITVPPEVRLIDFPVPAQCGRTFRHLPHPTDAGECAGLDGTETNASPAEDAVDPWALPVPYAALEQGLRILTEHAGGFCEHVHRGALGACFDHGRTADSPHGATLACAPCIAHRVLAGLPLPSGEPERTHRAVVEDALGHSMTVIAFGSEAYCRDALAEWLREHSLTEFQRGAVLQVVSGGC